MSCEESVALSVNEFILSEAAFFFERSLDLLSVIGLDGYFKRINPVFTQILGYSEAELLASPFLNFVHPDDHPTTLAEMEKLKHGVPTLNFENRYLTKDGRYCWLSWTASPQLDQEVMYCVARDMTQQKETEAALQQANRELEERVAERTRELEMVNAALRESEERNQLAMEVARIFTFEWEPNTDIVKRSPQCGVILGLNETVAEQDTGRNFFQRIHPDDRDRFVAILQALTPDNSTYKTTYRVLSSDGQIVILEESARALFDQQGQLTRLIGMTADVTERQRLTMELEASRTTLQRQLAEIETIYQSAPIGLNVLDPELRFVRINQRLADINGFSPEAHIGRTIREVLPNIADTAEGLLYPIFTTGEPLLNVEIHGETPAQPGVERVWLESFYPLKNGDRVIGINTVCEEITERKQAEEALRESEDRLRMAIASAQLGTWDWHLTTGELIWDSGCKAMFGLSPEAEINLDVFYAGLHPDDRDRLQKILDNALDPASGGAYDTEYRTIGIEDKIERWLRAKGQAYYDTNGKPLRFSGTVLNITEQKQVESQREKLLQQEQAAREAAERANRMKDEFLAILSHELRTPLNPILGWAKLLQSPMISADKVKHGLQTIERNAKQQVQLIDDLLDISRIIRGKLSLSFTAINLAEPITAALETVRLAAEAKEIQLEVLLNSSVGKVRGDASRLQQVIWNLLSNAIKFNSPGGRVRIQLSNVNGYAQIQVSDNGKGIHPEFLPHVFELFQQQDSSTTRAFGGLGLGLAITSQVVEAHGGTITAASLGEGQGSTFTVQLPLMPVGNAHPLDVYSYPTLNLENRRVMVVDDETDSLELVKVILEQEGATVSLVSSPLQALPLLTQDQFDLLISDIAMPEMDGYHFIRQVRALSPRFNRDVPAIALTAYAGENNQHQILAAGFQAHLAKPIEPLRLLDAIATVIRAG
jgi:PAS domain S-box-containing protein